MEIQNCNREHQEVILNFYSAATDFQKSKQMVSWPIFDPQLIESEIHENRQWKLLIDDQIACVWATTESDPQIWDDSHAVPALYIHRIATHPNFRGRNLVLEIVKWARVYAFRKEFRYVRMDTVGENSGLIKHYEKCGFDFLGLSKLENSKGLPAHYDKATVCLFQISI